MTPRAGVVPRTTLAGWPGGTLPPPLPEDAFPPSPICLSPEECRRFEGIADPTVGLSVTEGLEDLPETVSLPTAVSVSTAVAVATTVTIDADVEADEESGSPCPQSGEPLPQAFDVCSGPGGIEAAAVKDYDGCVLLIWTSGWGRIGGTVADDTWERHTADGLPVPCD